ncbi:MAG: hypothetical protein HQK58_14160 [Deltaproteobacteria bacterium]|nr:hypothetical protein [Deltaproteobacteria bacterium]
MRAWERFIHECNGKQEWDNDLSAEDTKFIVTWFNPNTQKWRKIYFQARIDAVRYANLACETSERIPVQVYKLIKEVWPHDHKKNLSNL